MSDFKSLAPIDDINLKVFDEICDIQFSKIDLDKLLVTIIDNLPSDALPHLAEQYHITGNEGWLHATTEEEKRNLIKSAIKIHRYKGTKFALEEVLRALNLTGKVTEWFEYGGEPYHFRIQLDSQKILADNDEVELRNLVNENKNVRSVFESLILHLVSDTYFKIVAPVITLEEIVV